LSLKIKQFLSSLPQSVLTGDDVSLPNNVIRKLFRFVRLRRSDVFYHLGCGTNNTIGIAAREFKVKKSVGVESRKSVAARARDNIAGIANAQITNQDIRRVRISDASVLLFWFTNPKIIGQMIKRFETELSDGARVITLWSPLDLMVPTKTKFPFFICKKPFNYAENLSEQIKAIYGAACIDFNASWLLADRYVYALQVVPGKYRRFLNMLHSVIIWINAWNSEVACEDEIPPPVTTYIGILKTFFNIDLSNLVKSRH
jgi:trans-aconitate methyltransferase